jgi:AraC-like DNA-binding protein
MNQVRLRSPFLEAIHSIKDYIDQHPLEIKTIEELIHKSHSPIGINLLHQGFRQLFGTRIKEYEIRKRLEAAAHLLQEDEMTMQEITSKCGYSSQSSFVRAFKDVHGITPGQWRNQHVPLLFQQTGQIHVPY